MDPGVSVFLGILTVGLGFVGMLVNDRREHRKAAEATAARMEAAAMAESRELEAALRERIVLKDEQLKDCNDRNTELAGKIRELGGTP